MALLRAPRRLTPRSRSLSMIVLRGDGVWRSCWGRAKGFRVACTGPGGSRMTLIHTTETKKAKP